MANDNPSPDNIRAMLRITCADAGVLLSDYHDGTLPADDRERVASHIGGCVACGVILEQIHTTTLALRAVGSARAVPEQDTIDRILARIHRA
ncbi:MAG: zf-HC2 domain-containing protein [Nocardiaceae bacterium]|nr:zf-HC2 domain-containing protein [Nocardiaceae bacterium]